MADGRYTGRVRGYGHGTALRYMAPGYPTRLVHMRHYWTWRVDMHAESVEPISHEGESGWTPHTATLCSFRPTAHIDAGGHSRATRNTLERKRQCNERPRACARAFRDSGALPLPLAGNLRGAAARTAAARLGAHPACCCSLRRHQARRNSQHNSRRRSSRTAGSASAHHHPKLRVTQREPQLQQATARCSTPSTRS